MAWGSGGLPHEDRTPPMRRVARTRVGHRRHPARSRTTRAPPARPSSSISNQNSSARMESIKKALKSDKLSRRVNPSGVKGDAPIAPPADEVGAEDVTLETARPRRKATTSRCPRRHAGGGRRLTPARTSGSRRAPVLFGARITFVTPPVDSRTGDVIKGWDLGHRRHARRWPAQARRAKQIGVRQEGLWTGNSAKQHLIVRRHARAHTVTKLNHNTSQSPSAAYHARYAASNACNRPSNSKSRHQQTS